MPISRTTLFAFGVCALGYLLTIPYSPYPSSALVKALPIFILVAVALTTLSGRPRVFMALALVFSSGGDIFLELNQFTPGLSSFLVAQLCYAWFFLCARKLGKPPFARLAIIFAIMLGVSVPVVSHAGELFIPVAVYMAAVTAMGLGAALYQTPSAMVFIGALLFVISDSMIGINRFVTPLPGSHYAIMLTYYGAQLLMLVGVIQAGEKATV